MATFITRIELHGADDDDYKVLHAEMAARKFSRTILGDDGVRYRLPSAEYYSFGDLTATNVRTLAMAAAKATGQRYCVLVSEFTEAAFYLEPK